MPTPQELAMALRQGGMGQMTDQDRAMMNGQQMGAMQQMQANAMQGMGAMTNADRTGMQQAVPMMGQPAPMGMNPQMGMPQSMGATQGGLTAQEAAYLQSLSR
jgi:hypothetical protein